ncbi:MAG: DNA-binding protein [Hormoscilla sp.]
MQESFSQAAGRHLNDAFTLLKADRWDNAVYLAGYVVECAFKVLVEIYLERDRAAVKKYGHDLEELEGKAMSRLKVMYPVLDMQAATARTTETVLAQNHPERRYAQSGIWTENQARAAVLRANEIYREIVTKLVLDGRISSRGL